MERMDFKSFCNAVVNGIAEYLLQYEIESTSNAVSRRNS